MPRLVSVESIPRFSKSNAEIFQIGCVMCCVNLGTGYMVDLTNERTLLKLDIQYVIRTVNIGSVTSFKQNELRFTLGWPEYTSLYFCLLVQESSCCHNIIQTFLQLRSVKIVQVIFFLSV